MGGKCEGDFFSLNEGNVLNSFFVSCVRLRFTPLNYELERRTVHLLRQMLMSSFNQTRAWDALRRTQLLNLVVEALGSRSRLHSLASESTILEDYMRVIELAAEANAFECMRQITLDGSTDAGLFAFFTLLVRIPLLDGGLNLHRTCLNSYVRTILLLLSDARSCILLTRMRLSPMQLLLNSLAQTPLDRQDVSLFGFRGIVQILLGTSQLTKMWVEDFANFDGPAKCLSTIIQWCSMNEDLSAPLCEKSTLLFDILCLFLSLPDSGRLPCHSLYIYLMSFHWEMEEMEPDPSVYKSTLGFFGLRLLVRAALVAMKRRRLLFYYLCRLLTCAIRIGNADIVAAGLVSGDMVDVLRRYMYYCSEMEEVDVGSVIATIVRLSLMVCASQTRYVKQKNGGFRLCALVVELASSPNTRTLRYTIQTLTLLAGLGNEAFFFTKLVSAGLFEELSKRLQYLSSPGEIQLVIELLKEVCTRVPSLQGRFLRISDTIVDLMQNEVKNGPRLLLESADLLSLVMVQSREGESKIQKSLQRLLTQTNFESIGSIITSCWALQTCIRSVNLCSAARVFDLTEVESILVCFRDLCVSMGSIFCLKLRNFDFCVLYDEMSAYHRHQRDACGTEQQPQQRYLLMCDFLLLVTHLISLLHVNAPEKSRIVLSRKLEEIIVAGPFLQCRLYTSIITRAFLGMCSVSSFVLLGKIQASKEPCIDVSVTRQNLTSGWKLCTSYGDDLFACEKQRIVFPEYLQSLFKVLYRQSQTAEQALLGASIIYLLLDIYSNCLENIYALAERRTVTLLSEILAVTIAGNEGCMKKCIQQLVTVTQKLGACGFSHHALLFLIQMCLRRRTVDSVEYENLATTTVLSAWKKMLQNSTPSSQPMSFLGISVGFPTVTGCQMTAIQRLKSDMGLYGGVDIPIHLTVPKSRKCISAVLWFLVEKSTPLSVEDADFVLLSLFMDRNNLSLLLVLSDGGELSLRVVLQGNRGQTSKIVPVPFIKVPREKWCMVAMSVLLGHRAKTSIYTKIRMDIKISLHAASHDAVSSSTEATLCIEISLGVLGRVDRWPWKVYSVCLGASCASTDACPQQLLFGSLGMFAGPLSKLEKTSLFVMGSDNLFSLSFMDRNFVIDLYPTLANIMEREEGKLTEELMLLSAVWIRSGIPNTKGQVRFSRAPFPFCNYCSKEYLPVVVGVFGGELCLVTQPERRGISGDMAERQDADVTSWSPAFYRLTKIGSVTRVSLRLSTDEENIRHFGSMWVEANGPRFHSVTPIYSALDAVGGIPFFLWLASLQAPHSKAFEEVWECVCAIILGHSPESLLCPTPSHGGRHLVVVLRAMLHARIAISEKTAASLFEAVGHCLIVRADLLSLMLDFTLWSQDADAFRMVLCKLEKYAVDPQYGSFNSQILRFGANSQFGVNGCYALEKFLMHLLMYFAGHTNGNWDTSIIGCAMSFVTALCWRTSHLRKIVQAVICLFMGNETPQLVLVEWAVGLLNVVHSVMRTSDPGKLKEDKFLSSSVVALLKCSDEMVRCKALPLFSYLLIPREQIVAAVDVYLTRKATFPDSPCLSKKELDIITDVVRRGAKLGETGRVQALVSFLLALFLHLPTAFQMQIMQLFREVVENKGLSSRDLLCGAEGGECLVEPIPSYLIGIFPTVASEGSAVMEPFIELLTATAVQMIKVSWGSEDATCKHLLRDAIRVIFQTLPIRGENEHARVGEMDLNRTGMFLNCFGAPCFHMFAVLSKRGCSLSLVDDYFSFIRSNADIVMLLNWYESDDRSSNEATSPSDTGIHHTILAHTYLVRLGKVLALKRHQTGLRLTLLVLECAQKLFFELQLGDLSWMPRKRIEKMSEDLLLLQWRIVATVLYDAEKTDDDVVKELMLLHLAHSGVAEYGIHYSPWEKHKALVEPPDGADWKHLWLSPNTLLIELLNKTRGEALKEYAPWLIVLRAAFTFLYTPLRSNSSRLSMALSICRLIRYNAGVWSLVKRGVSSCSTAELDGAIKADQQALGAEDAATFDDSLWGIELSNNGVAAMEKYITTARSKTMRSLELYGPEKRPSLLSMDPKQAVQCHDQTSAKIRQFQAFIWKEAALYKKCVKEEGSAIISAHAAYRFSLLPWWGHCISLYSKSPVPLDRWELDRFMGAEWQRIRLRRFIHNVRMTDTESSDQLLRGVYRDDMASTDDVSLLHFYSITAVPQLSTVDGPETVSLAVKCKLVLPMDRLPIILYIAPKNISYIVDWFQHSLMQLEKESTGELFHSHDSGPSTFAEMHELENRLPKTFKHQQELPCLRRVVKVSSIRAVWPRRNLLQPRALELLLFNGETLFLAFDSEEMKKAVIESITHYARPHLDKNLMLTENNLRMWRNWWCEGRISNFHYLMYLNFAAGRSYGDLRQYPVFPHVVADFLSDTLDLSLPTVYRRFDRPMGAQTPERESKAIQKYDEMAVLPKTERNVPIELIPYHHGSHYSPVGGALHFLVRVQPFSDYFLDMNSKLDDAGRVFDSMATAYFISTGKDVKELLPELYCLPEMFLNLNRIPFGVKQDGRIVNDVHLPPWASTPRELTQKLRQALESRYTSENLHSWIDLVFGYKQRGKEAVTAVNVFHPLTYEGFIDLSKIKDPVLLSGHEAQIDCYGQVPLQLFTQQHKARGKSTDPSFLQSPCPTLRYEASNSRSCIVLHPENLTPILNASKVDGTVVVFPRTRPSTSARGAEESSEWKFPLIHPRPMALPKDCLAFTVVNDQLKDCLFLRGNCIVLVDGKDLSREMCSFHLGNGRATTFTVDTPNVYVGMASGAIHVLTINNEEWTEVEQPIQEEVGNKNSMMREAEKAPQKEKKMMRNRGAVRRRVFVLYGHMEPVTALCVSAEWGILVSTAEDYKVAVWDTARLVLLRTIPFPCPTAKDPESLLSANIWLQGCGSDDPWLYDLVAVNAKEGDIILAGCSLNSEHAVRLYTLNGSLVASYEIEEGPASALLSVGGVVFVAQGTAVRVLRERDLQWLCNIHHPSIEDSIKSLALSPNGTILAACDRKSNLVTWRVGI
ncbi:putative neurobeachin/beige protein [Trypanosoma cruzi]|uniref:Neurobeachin/beige-like protein, putative n=1 Tax=Trypanosoma cruzi (strain CL Brener) TaxID=353153 RepID=Q4D289_TRYCC|nr:neurobeachin/beige-like protein, putative [Trypanosoma cruzi]EAN86641.1 neurobeachin/beige-like protein, putative [Trypanosoma cruzi]RNC61014.1 putative neurobeachin/beige protein [Trypanosoma cruzi]|eukprot:XP_808492.1 neurobeachin/beige-like protein [Trypanosoma cruzi strain CL Brener]